MRRERGAAILAALLVVVLATTIVAGLMASQEIRLKSLDNQRLRDQMNWLSEGALDWVRLILKEDLYQTKAVDHLGEVWAIPISETSLADFLKTRALSGTMFSYDEETFFAGHIVDANARFNLTSLIDTVNDPRQGGFLIATKINLEAVNMFERILLHVGLDPQLSMPVAQWLLNSHRPLGEEQDMPLPILSVPDLRVIIPSISDSQLAALEQLVVLLPRPTPININTASARVLSLTLGIPIELAQQLINDRQQKYFVDYASITSRIKASIPAWTPVTQRNVDVKTDYFFVLEQLRKRELIIRRFALISRIQSINNATQVLHVGNGYPLGLTFDGV
ncbi:MAG: hypothetical protein B7Z60_06440 [Ferrovum sp. 37-45-19]|nr:MAG: hypothetical protein B7Z65_04470 [Ferrovum sp. 21-44-67]OYV94082.1 MAG: hypothetical protein B7Z60_06440 [Ferrovum sp. 37-45-19]OZB33972.1 MAG: hypothetical protein B7X47_02390 [Ferrovum sp. 34-44-207]HQT82096.1 type II secretion system minor pseudopilin GspK [Ferrovaceae bacterium]HQU05846.1 type II secretion system minor pseudopilin GspK [Ferrovaceae bacterium]